MRRHACKILRHLLALGRALVVMSLVMVVTVPAASGAETPIVAPGITESFLEVTLSSSVAGIIGNEPYKEGEFVMNGAVVVELDRKLEELEVERRKLIVDVRKSDFEGTQKLFTKTKGTSKEELEKKETEYRVAVVEHETAIEQLRKRYIVTPFAGHITEILIHSGEACQPYQPVVRMVDTRQCFFVSNIETKLAASLKTNQVLRLEIETGAVPIQVEGRISFLSPIADPASGLVKVKVLFPNAAGQIRPGLAGIVFLTPSPRALP
ncbi:MAG TPA: efflux RND transporter periplasmic adaptor subunit [Candidatus Limnocylindria bacterium]|nr:efflux RND transporter periplasmic adaptor subunit [Candidatus Limnocylindria bacterium]